MWLIGVTLKSSSPCALRPCQQRLLQVRYRRVCRSGVLQQLLFVLLSCNRNYYNPLKPLQVLHEEAQQAFNSLQQHEARAVEVKRGSPCASTLSLAMHLMGHGSFVCHKLFWISYRQFRPVQPWQRTLASWKSSWRLSSRYYPYHAALGMPHMQKS